MKASIALPIAQTICRSLNDYCNIIKIAGSIRRLKEEVKDIEIVVSPKYINIPPVKDLFYDGAGQNNIEIHPQFKAIVNNLGKVIKGKPTGKYMQIELPEGINLDLFIPDHFDFYRQFSIRTGSAEFVKLKIAAGWKRIGWCGSDVGLRKISDCEEKISPNTGDRKYICKNKHAEKPPVWTSEKDFFEWLKIPYVKPIYRNL